MAESKDENRDGMDGKHNLVGCHQGANTMDVNSGASLAGQSMDDCSVANQVVTPMAVSDPAKVVNGSSTVEIGSWMVHG